MKDIIVLENETPILSGDVSVALKEIEKEIKYLKEKEDEIKQSILAEMESKNILKLENDNLTINYIASSDRETFDSKKFKAEHQDLYDEYVKMTTVKSSIRVKVKDE